MKSTPSSQNQEQDQEIIELLKGLESLKVEYPPELLAARRAAFIGQAKQHARDRVKEELASENDFLKSLDDLKSANVEYPPELLAPRRAAFIARVKQLGNVEVEEELYSKDQEIIKLFRSIKSAEAEYPSNLMAARRVAFRRQIAPGGRISLLEALRSFIQVLFSYKVKPLPVAAMNMLRTSLVIAVLMVATFIGPLFGNREPVFSPSPTQSEVSQLDSSSLSLATSTGEVAKVMCKPGYLPPLCLAKEFDKSEDLTFSGNGAARPAVAKDTLPGYSGVHKAEYLNDGLYGPGASWISNSAYSWIKLDLGKASTINTVTFGRDRLGNFNDRDPGQFVIAVALSDNIYADGNSSNDYIEYTQIYDSEKTGFSGIVSGSETIKASFGPVKARFVKIVFTNAGTAVDEVEVFMTRLPVLATHPTKKSDDDAPAVNSPPVFFNTPVPTNTVRPIPTNTPQPTDTPIPPPTDTRVPPPTDTPRPPSTSTPVPPTDIPPTDIPPTNIPPTNIPSTDIPPTNIPPTDAPPVDTPISESINTSPPVIASAESSTQIAGP